MEFASTHVYNYDESDEEEITETDLDLSSHYQALRSAKASDAYMPLQIRGGVGQSEATYDHTPLFKPSRDVIYDNAGFQPTSRNRHEEAIYDNRMPELPPPRVKAKAQNKDSGDYASAYDTPRQANPYYYIHGEGAPQEPPPLPPMRKPVKKEPSKKHRRADTNVIAVKFDTLVSSSHQHAGSPIFCCNCDAAFSSVSQTNTEMWKCEFCDRENPVTATMQNFPQENDLTFTIQPGSGGGDDTAVIFMVDISGSMSVTTAVPGGTFKDQRLNDEGTALSAYREQLAEQEDRYTAGPKREYSYISRLQAMQSAIDQQLSKMERTLGNKRVGIVAFNDSVTVIGDGSQDPVPLEGAGLTDEQSIISLGKIFPLPAPISEVRRCLSDKVFSLTEGGQTALGPALMLSVAMASQKPGSKVIVCTDGLANVGLGKLDVTDDEHYDKASEFYEYVGHYARDSGTCVSVLTMEGEDCRVIELGNVADKTGGQVNVVDPMKLNEEFANILDDPILATNVSAKLVLHKGLYFRDDENMAGEHASQATRNIGIVTKDSETTFEFGVRTKPVREVIYDNFGGLTITHKDDEVKEEPVYDSINPKSMIEGMERLPFQLQIYFTGRDGAQNLRVITMDRPITKDRHFAEQNANVAVLGAHAAQSAAKLAVEGLYGEARINALVTQKLVERHAQHQGDEGEDVYQSFVATLAPIQSELYRAHTSARRQPGARPGAGFEDEEDEPAEYTFFIGNQKSAKRGLSKKAKKRRQKITDKQANLFYKMKNATSNMFQKHKGQMKMGNIN
ncbi:circularly permutated Ras protein 1-like isoform X2 [Acanthaster planci]|uniref:Circularly permutated Ras protein 1-like isoform X2 n=1 Tax=Acanthaster planci TaxID=133434 RepID=A0A8B7YNA8_ACAPL|nr:circularly permutated Ras protein 1-like isoform X2 [Acanthaster planci]